MRFATWVFATILITTFVGSVKAQTDQGGTTPIELSIVRIVTYANGTPISAGSGVITSANGVIFTNEHVVACGNDYVIEIIEDIEQINRPPVARYMATVVGAYPGLDFAILQINRKIDQATNQITSVLPGEISLPFIPPAEGIEVNRQNEVVVYGYPAIAGGVLQVSTGQITGIRDADIEGIGSVTVQYQTDALIAHGNSGGAAIIDGRYIGIPSAVNVDDTNSVGIIRPISTALAVARAITPVPPKCESEQAVEPTPEENTTPLANALVVMTFASATDALPGGDWETRQVYLLDTRSSNPPVSLTDCGLNWAPSWSPDGSKIVYASTCNQNGDNSNGDAEIWLMNADGSGKTQLTFTEDWEDSPHWSPDGQHLVYTLPDTTNYLPDIWIINIDGSNAHPLSAANTPGYEVYPSWSPNGKWIAFSYSEQDTGSSYKVCFAAADGSGSRSCPIDQGNANSIWDTGVSGWAPDSQSIIYRVNGGSLYIASIDGSNIQDLTGDIAGWKSNPFLSANGTTVFFNGGVQEESWRGKVYRMRSDGTDVQSITIANGSGWQPSFHEVP